jgi:hypothetical protein
MVAVAAAGIAAAAAAALGLLRLEEGNERKNVYIAWKR